MTLNANFKNNKARYGGAINFFENMGNTTIHATFTNNTAENGKNISIQTQ